MYRDFILPVERHSFVERMYDIIQKAESMMEQQAEEGVSKGAETKVCSSVCVDR